MQFIPVHTESRLFFHLALDSQQHSNTTPENYPSPNHFNYRSFHPGLIAATLITILFVSLIFLRRFL